MVRGRGIVVWAVLAVFLVGGAVFFAGAASSAETTAPIKIGYVSSFTGPIAESSKRHMDAFNLAIDEANQAGGVIGRQIVLVVRDDKGSPADHARLARDLVYSEKVDLLIGAHHSGNALAVAEVAKETKTPTFIIATGALGPSIQKNRYIFRTIPSVNVQTGTIASFAVKKGWKKIALMNPDYAYGHFFAEEIKKYLANHPGYSVVDEVWPKFGALDFAPYITKLLAIQGLDAVLSGVWGGDMITFTKQAKPYGFFQKVPIVTFVEAPVLEALGKDMPEGVYGFGHFFPWMPYKGAMPFSKKFYNASGHYPVLAYNGYVSGLAYVAAVKKAGSADKEAVIKALEGLTIDTPTVPMTIRPFDHQITMGAVIGKTVFRADFPEFAALDDFYLPDPVQFLPTKDDIEKLKPF
jgi:branched-chain amino acid transport system substrate-binding protein